MKLKQSLPLCVVLTVACVSASADEHRVEVLEEVAPADAISAEIAQTLSPAGVRVIRGTSRTVCDIWLCKELPVKADFAATAELLYPFEPGQLIGIVRFGRRGADFRDLRMSRGVYTLRFGLQPVDGNHEGTSPTRDFLLMVKADADSSPDKMDYEQLQELSAEAARSEHPAMLCLQKAAESDGPTPSIRHDEHHDWWIARLEAKAAGESQNISLDLVVAGQAVE